MKKEAQSYRSLVKQFRRSLSGLKSGENLLHTTERKPRIGMQGVLADGFLRPSRKVPGDVVAHASQGDGVYWLRRGPDGTYFSRPGSEGFIVPIKNVQLRDNAHAVSELGTPLSPKHGLSSSYRLTGKDTAVVDWKGRFAEAARGLTGDLSKEEGKRSARNALQEIYRGHRPVKNDFKLDPAEWDARRRALHVSDPELGRIKNRPREPGENIGDRDEEIADFIEDKIGLRPRGGLRNTDSQVFNLAYRRLESLGNAAQPPVGLDPQIKQIYKERLKQRRELRRLDLLPKTKNALPRPGS